MTDDKLARINELAKKKKSEGLTEEERLEQEALRKAYIAEFRKNLRGNLENMEFEYPDGKVVTLRELRAKKTPEV